MTGNCSDVQFVKDSGILDLLEEGDSVMADKGFVVGELLAQQKVGLNTPPFRFNSGQFTTEQIDLSTSISRLRVHVERAIRRAKANRFFSDAHSPEVHWQHQPVVDGCDSADKPPWTSCQELCSKCRC